MVRFLPIFSVVVKGTFLTYQYASSLSLSRAQRREALELDDLLTEPLAQSVDLHVNNV